MKIRRVNRYYCDFCPKAGCSSGAMRKHETHCTVNPGRVCRFCAYVKAKQQPITALMALLPDPQEYAEETDFGGVTYRPGFAAVLANGLRALRESTSNCPACVLAALRQSGIPSYLTTDFDFKKEAADFWAKLNAERQDDEHRA